jgi:hypothetical protein
MPGELDFWLVGVYSDLELKGNMFSSRNLMMQGLRMNDTDPKFHLEYMRFELKFFEKIMMRREVLKSGAKVDFINDCDEKPVEGETQRGDEANFVKIVWKSISDRFGANALVLKDAK